MLSKTRDNQGNEFFNKIMIPLFDVEVNNPFSIDPKNMKIEPVYDIIVEAKLPPLFKIDLPYIEVKELAYIVSPETVSSWRSSFEDLAVGVPVLSQKLIEAPSYIKEDLDKKIRMKKLSGVKIEPEKIEIKIHRASRKDVPEDMREQYSIKIRLKKEITPEIREILESRLTKEFKITRMVKKMEIIRDERALTELELLLRDIAKKLRLHKLIGKSPSSK